MPNFMPINSITEEYELKNLNKNGYYIMPTTYQVITISYNLSLKYTGNSSSQFNQTKNSSSKPLNEPY
jgi:hypothetical protein